MENLHKLEDAEEVLEEGFREYYSKLEDAHEVLEEGLRAYYSNKAEVANGMFRILRTEVSLFEAIRTRRAGTYILDGEGFFLDFADGWFMLTPLPADDPVVRG